MRREAEDARKAGLCASCGHVRVLGNDRGSIFYQCVKALRDASYRKYPALPVLDCKGYEQAGGDQTTERDSP